MSYPKSGRTWLKVMVGRALCLHGRLSSRLLLDTPALTAALGLPRTSFTHDGSSVRESVDFRRLSRDKHSFRQSKVLFLARDVKDILVSSYHEVTRRSLVFEHDPVHFEGTIGQFVRSPVFGARKVSAFYEVWARNVTVPLEFLLIRYEELHRAPTEVLTTVLRFIGADAIDQEHVIAAAGYAGFENMRELERADAFDDPCLRPGDPTDPESFKVRRGTVGGYVDYLSPGDVAYIEGEMSRRGSPFDRSMVQR